VERHNRLNRLLPQTPLKLLPTVPNIMTYIDYYIRTTAAHWDEVISFGVLLGVIQEVERDDGSTVVVEKGPGCWHYIGQISIRVGGTDEEPEFDALKNSEGEELLHANLRTTINLRERAMELAGENPELSEAMGRLGDYFLLDSEGNARTPNSPYNVPFR